jgi:hypothetical protein
MLPNHNKPTCAPAHFLCSESPVRGYIDIAAVAYESRLCLLLRRVTRPRRAPCSIRGG